MPPGTASVEGALLFSQKMLGEGASQDWLWREGETPSDHKLLTPVVCGGGFDSVYEHEQAVDGRGEGGQSRHKAGARKHLRRRAFLISGACCLKMTEVSSRSKAAAFKARVVLV